MVSRIEGRTRQRMSVRLFARSMMASAAAAAALPGVAEAGGFAIREQSASSQGASFAGSAAGYDLSSMYWNPAAVGVRTGPGIHTESHYSVIMPYAKIEVETVDTPGPGGALPASLFGAPTNSGGIASPAIVGASYVSYQLSPQWFVGMSLNSPFGLTTKPNELDYAGASLARTTRLITFNAAPTVGYRLAPGLTVAAGVQVQYGDGRLNLANFPTVLPAGLSPFPPGNAEFDGDGFAFGGTAGLLYQPSPDTSIGLGYRSRLTQKLDGDFTFGDGRYFDAEADIELPDIVTLSVRQTVLPGARLLGTVEWSNWSRFKELRVEGVPGQQIAFEAGWSDGWLFSLGGEVDMPNGVTLRTGVGYEVSPVDSPEKRLVSIPDADRIWLSGGASFQIMPQTYVDLAYTHIFIDDGDFAREDLAGVAYTGSVDAHTDIVSVSLKSRW